MATRSSAEKNSIDDEALCFAEIIFVARLAVAGLSESAFQMLVDDVQGRLSQFA